MHLKEIKLGLPICPTRLEDTHCELYFGFMNIDRPEWWIFSYN